MYRVMLKSKIHRARVTSSDLNYVGSLTVDSDLLRSADIAEYEKVHVLNINNGARFETYVFAGEAGSGEVKVNGAAARLAHPGDLVIVVAYASYSPEELACYEPRVIFVDESNRQLMRASEHAVLPAQA